ncbi:hypothetical protein [Streptomyces sp. 6N223]|uniref:hypothetical protein n=1 Tax=Streptomyces sp. 6N223 TaxID=3457412 RepID=UPI003FD043E3
MRVDHRTRIRMLRIGTKSDTKRGHWGRRGRGGGPNRASAGRYCCQPCHQKGPGRRRKRRGPGLEIDAHYREWDDDLTAGALHLVETLEFLHVVRTIGWRHAITLDLFPYREDPAAAVRESVATLRALEERAARLPLDELREAQFRHDAMAVERIVPELRRSAEGRTASDGQGVLTSKLSTSTSPPRARVAWLKTAKR